MHAYTCYTSCSLCFADSFKEQKKFKHAHACSSLYILNYSFQFPQCRQLHIYISFAFAGFGFGLPAVPKTPNHRPGHVLFYIKLLTKSLLNLIILIYNSFCILAFQGTKATSIFLLFNICFSTIIWMTYIMLFYVHKVFCFLIFYLRGSIDKKIET